MIGREVSVLLAAYLLAGIPVAAAALAGRLSPMYRLPARRLLRYWSWMALLLVVAALTVNVVGAVL